jgi:hypothetical protein
VNVRAELTTTFASTYTREVSLAGMLKPDAVKAMSGTVGDALRFAEARP